MQHLILLRALRAFAFVCTTVSAQVASDKLPEGDLRLIQQEATITVFGGKAVEIELLSNKEGLPPKKHKLAGPGVQVYSVPGEVFQIDDINSATVAGVLGKDDVTFYGDLILTSVEWSDQPHVSNSFLAHDYDSLRVHVYDALVEIRTIWISVPDSVNQVSQQQARQAVPLNHQGDFIRRMKEKAKKRRNL